MNGDLTTLLPGDFNGDGRTDFLRQERGGFAFDTVRMLETVVSNSDGSFRIWHRMDDLTMNGDLTTLSTGNRAVGVVTTITPPPPLGYYRELSSLSESQWDNYSGDNTRFGDVMWQGEVDQRNLTPDSIEQIYTDLSTSIFGRRERMSAGYLYDQSYRNGLGKWHAGIDIAAPAGSSVRVPIGGTVAWTWYSATSGAFIGVTSSDGRQWVYGHLQGLGNWRTGMPISAGTVIGIVGNQSGARHLHLEVRTPPFLSTGGASPNQDFLRNATMSPLQAYWQWRNR
jgi:hypothetical protein